MPARSLYLAAYDICDPRRLRKGLAVMKQFATGGQKSVFECFLTEAEKNRLIREMKDVIDPREDRFFLIPVEMRSPVRTLGIAIPPEDPPFYYAG
ncbi:MAG: CRISPR-associated endonuclease Cas2 [Bryobacteraceae bacterium]|nr:CRISPR-associated endonuclease Cas2 [Bryobacteraceae bacterium]MCX7602859.1 CRISPR-associated endonuclease Cas2 [Bryobacteraceae bacterium]